MLSELLNQAGPLINQSLSAAIAIIAASFFLYTLVKDSDNQIARLFSLLMFFVLVTYIGDIGVTFTRDAAETVSWLRLQWFGIAFVPALYVNLSHEILTMTGLPSRGRRIWAVRGMYVFAIFFLVLVLFTDLLVVGLQVEPAPHFMPGPLFWLFVLYFGGTVTTSMWFVVRARQRAKMRSTRRRLSYLLLPYFAPALSVFPFLLISGPRLYYPVAFYAMLIVTDAVLAVMLAFMAYAMSFLGTLRPERLIKAQMLQFFLRGPVVAIAALAVIIWVPRAGAVLGLPGEEAMPLFAVTVILLLQWAITVIRPHLDRWLVYSVDYDEINRIQDLEERLITGTDFHQMLETILTSLCDYLRIESVFVASITPEGPNLEHAIALPEHLGRQFESSVRVPEVAGNGGGVPLEEQAAANDLFTWEGFWLIPLHVITVGGTEPRLVGLLGVDEPETVDGTLEDEQLQVLMGLASRTAEVLENRRIQSQVFASLEGLLPETGSLEVLRRAARDGAEGIAEASSMVEANPDFSNKIKDALSHYWGGPQLTDSSLMRLSVVQQSMDEHEGNPQRAMRAVLERAIESLRPEGQRSMTTAEWILYNILEMRFIQGRKVRDVAMRLAMSESDLYRKQRVAIEAIASIIAEMERSSDEAADR